LAFPGKEPPVLRKKRAALIWGRQFLLNAANGPAAATSYSRKPRRDLYMTALKQIRWTAIAILVTGLALAFGAGLIETEALAAQEGQFAHTASVMAGKMFTVSSILILIWATEWQRAKTSARLQKLEEELNSIKRHTAALA
jgi:hypothetical protein